MRTDIEKKLSSLTIKPLTQNEEHILWSRVKEGFYGAQAAAAEARTPFRKKLLNMKTLIASALVFSLLGGSTVAAANSAKPGDLLFPIDIAAEKVRIILATNEAKDELRIKFAEERLGEARVLLSIRAAAIEFETADNATTTMPIAATSSPLASSTTTTQAATATAATTAPPASESAKSSVTGNLAIVLAHLEQTRNDLAAHGNTAGVSAIEHMIAELMRMSEEHGEDFDEIQAKIQNDGNKVKVEVKAEAGDTKAKLSFKSKESGNGTTTSHEIKIESGNAKVEIKTKYNGSNSVEIKAGNGKVSIKKRTGGHDEEDEDDDEDNDHDDWDDWKKKLEKVEVCHKWFFKKSRTITIARAALDAHLKHGDTIGACDDDEDEDSDDEDEDDDDTGTSTPDTTAPVISNVGADAATTTASVHWDTDEAASSVVWYGTTTPLVVASSTAKESSGALVATHTLSLAGLSASTTYYYLVTGADEAGNTATSTEQSFITLSDEIPEPPDTTAPVLSAITATSTAATSTAIMWQSDEPSTSVVWYGTVTPLVISSSTPTASDPALVLDHSLLLSGLSATTTYYYIVSSSDADANTATSTEFSFTTL